MIHNGGYQKDSYGGSSVGRSDIIGDSYGYINGIIHPKARIWNIAF